ncbi:double-strand break repair helicase AddA [Nitratireductor mangrovi]|uniref:double-strand break repair helicase AddA n=1 Tax=Nitratireductor mangrovi TaxID=2599600 RepID=UPI001FEE70B9|nr:double-strand break repair helicase AddA [Nitratireductor mangrovi]
MSRKHPIPPDTTERQLRASDPRLSAWVSANAGSGKTHVLSRRVMRLLLDQVDPSRILCLTYTKAAAANMSTRVFRDLARWATLDDATLAEEVEALEERRPGPQRLRLARRLFARALETPGGLKIQTIHAFCEAVLHRFPLEANIAGHFELLDGRMEQALVAEARRDLLAGIDDPARLELAEAFAAVLKAGGEHGLEELLGEIVQKRDALRAFITEIAGTAPPFGDVAEEFGFSGHEDEESIIASAWPDPWFDAALAARLETAARAAGKKTATRFGELLAAACDASPSAGFAAARDLFLENKKSGVWVPRKTRQIMAAGVAEHFPEFEAEFARAAQTFTATVDRLAAWHMASQTRAALVIADWLIARYERLKSARGYLDFNDLINRTASLLSRTDVGPWIQYKLDQGIDHILVDEAQDTSPQQWRVVARLAEEFFAGRGARDDDIRTIFAVGDEKQSIYSFQGAEPEAFENYRRHFAARVEAAGHRFERVRLPHSFRSTEDVLQAVDSVFRRPEARAGLTRDSDPIDHRAIRVGDPGHVELWEQIAPQQVDEPDDWTEAIDHATAPAARLADIVAATIDRWLKTGERLEGPDRRIAPGDVLVLVRKRDRFIHALSRSLKNRHIAVAGADRLNLRTHIAVQDMIALGRFVLQPHDDLSLAALLKSPVFGVGEKDLFDVAADRGDLSLHAALRRKAQHEPHWAAVEERLARWRNEADTRTVFDFYAAILGRDGVRQQMVRRLGREAGDILDEFLSFCLASEKAGIEGLEAFLATLENAGPDIRREMDQSRDEVRIMTVHASKGLEAPVVILVDNGSAPFSESHLPRLMPMRSQKGLWQGEGFVWRAGRDSANSRSLAISQAIAAKAREEYRRLLYVGMTRAEDRLIVCGYRGVNEPDPGIWHTLVRTALDDEVTTEERHPVADLGVRHFRVTAPRPRAGAEEEPAPQPRAQAVPAFLHAPLPHAARLPRPLAPSGASAIIEPDRGPVAANVSPVLDPAAPSFAAARGTAMHRLLQSLPQLPVTAREEAAAAYLERVGSGWPAGECEAALRAVMSILAEPRFADVFAPGSRAEVALMGTLEVGGVPRAISGKIDRIAVAGDEVLIVDYKTGRPPPSDVSQVPFGHVAQMALYRELLRPLYPGRRVTAALLFTEAPMLLHVPAEAMDGALVRLTPA